MNFYQQPFFGMQPGMPYMNPQMPTPFPMPMPMPQPNLDMGQPFQEQSYIENILRMNLGKVATVYMSFEGSQWGSKIFKGYLLAAGKDHIILKDLQSELRYLLLTIYLSYITFDEPLEYDYPIRGKKEQG